MTEVPWPEEPPRSLEDQISDLEHVNRQLREKLARYGRDDVT